MTFSIRTAEPGYYPDLGHLWLDSFWASRYAKRFAGKSQYFRQHRPVVLDILRRAETRIVYDPEAPEVFWAFAVTEGDVVHYVFAKRRFHREEQSADMFRALFGDRLEKPAVYSHELVEFRRPEIVKVGLVVPENWVLDEYSAFPVRSAA